MSNPIVPITRSEDQVIAEWLCPCGARGTLFDGATVEEQAAFWDDSSWHDECEPRERPPADVLPDTPALAALIPDVIATRVAIEDSARIIARARGEHGYYGLRSQQDYMESMIAYVVRLGDGIAEAREWALRAALLRDAAPTHAERDAA